MSDTANTNPQAVRVREKMAELEEALDVNLPGFAHILKDIHECLRADPDVVTILAEEEIALIVKGLEKHTGQVVVPKGAKKPAAKKPKVTADDL